MKVELTEELIKSVLHYNRHTGIFTWKFIVISGWPFRAHRLAMIYTGHDLKEKDIVDHINGNGLDNKYDNLRVVNFKINSKNSRKATNNTSGVTVVHYS